MYYNSVTVILPLPDGIYCIMTGRWLTERYYNNIELYREIRWRKMFNMSEHNLLKYIHGYRIAIL